MPPNQWALRVGKETGLGYEAVRPALNRLTYAGWSTEECERLCQDAADAGRDPWEMAIEATPDLPEVRRSA